jgi:SpoVK/Ycf46/Vps4 family AAA+-type ATPase
MITLLTHLQVSSDLSPADLDKVVAKTEGYSGSDMRNLIQEACQGPVRAAVARVGEHVAALSDADLRPVRKFTCAKKVGGASAVLPCCCCCCGGGFYH